MALMTCPDCGREVSTLAEACPQCGHPFTPQHAETPKTEVSGSAVASLVFSLLWLGGIGSFLAVAFRNPDLTQIRLVFILFWLGGIGSILGVGFGHYSLTQIRRSGGRLGGHGIAMAGTVLGYVGIVGAIAVVIAAMMVGEEINSNFDAQASETPTSVVASTTTTTTAALSFWAESDEEAAQAWAEGAIEYVESLNLTWDDREAAIRSNTAWARRVCGQLAGSDLPNPDDEFFAYLHRSPAQVEADMRERLSLQSWERYGPVWYESLVFGLCVR